MSMKDTYFDSVVMIERLHHLFLEVIKGELDRFGKRDINNVQALILYNIADNQLTVGELTNRGYYLGSNVSYNLRKMVQNVYIEQIPSRHDRRSSHVKLSEKGMDLYKKIDDTLANHTSKIINHIDDESSFGKFCGTLKRLEGFWSEMLIR